MQFYANKIADEMVLSPEFSTPSTIGIFAPWGSGKSRFMGFVSKWESKLFAQLAEVIKLV